MTVLCLAQLTAVEHRRSLVSWCSHDVASHTVVGSDVPPTSTTVVDWKTGVVVG